MWRNYYKRWESMTIERLAPLVVDEPLDERRVPAIKLEIAIGDVVVRTDAAIDEKQLSRVIRAVRASR
jgi:transposase